MYRGIIMNKRKTQNLYSVGCLGIILIILVIGLIIDLITTIAEGISSNWPIIIGIVFCIALLIFSYKIYVESYFKGSKFTSIKNNISSYIKECNELDDHIEELKSSYVNYHKIDFGEAQYQNAGTYNYKREKIVNATYSPYIYDCSKTVCENARRQPFKYVCKYFGIKPSKKTLEEFEEILNNFLSAEDGKVYLAKKKDAILNRISNEIPWIIKKYQSERLDNELGFDAYNFKELYFPEFTFRYISDAGTSGLTYSLVLDISMLERFINYLADVIKFNESVKGQRRLMTPKLRTQILERDGYTCKHCKNSTSIEPNLLLEVDHIIPLAKGGITSEDNLQTLCWKCNRHKGAKLPNE